MSCSNCYNGCTEITSDKCVRYTGIDIPVLGIKNGDSLSYVEQALIEFLVSTLDGSGIKIDIPQNIICTAVANNLTTCTDLTVVNLIEALIKTACDLQVEIAALQADVAIIQAEIAEINGPYVTSCLTNLPANPTTHDVVQSIISTLCAFITTVETNYVLIADINTYIQNYLNSQSSTSVKVYNKMVPYVAYEYYGSTTSNFDPSGAGIGDWEKIYLCNGNNGTPDKRGRVAVGVTDGTMLGAPMSPTINPSSSPLNPVYIKNDTTVGANGISLAVSELPSHTHVPTVNFEDPGHKHGISYDFLINGNVEGGIKGSADWRTEGNKVTDSAKTGITISVTNANTGGDQAHSNVQPGIGCLYIMYIP